MNTFTDAKKENGGYFYLVQFYDASEPESIVSRQVKEIWPQRLIRFFEQKTAWKRTLQFAENGNNDQQVDVQQADVQQDDPIEIECNYNTAILYNYYPNK